MTTFRVGQRVRHTGWGAAPAGIDTLGKYARITNLFGAGDGTCEVCWEDPVLEMHFSKADRGRGREWGPVSVWFDPAPPTLDGSEPIVTRNGQPVSIEHTGDKDRPYRAKVRVSGKELDLSFDKDGRFCPYGESAVDLVNT